MLDNRETIRLWLEGDESLVAATGGRIYGPPAAQAGYEPEDDGEALVFLDGEDGEVNGEGPFETLGLTFFCYAPTETRARSLAGVLRGRLHGVTMATAGDGRILWATQTTPGETERSAESGWCRVVVEYRAECWTGE